MERWLSPHRVLRLSVLNQPPGPGVLDAGGRAGRNFAPERQAESISLFGALADHIKALRKDGTAWCWPASRTGRANGWRGC